MWREIGPGACNDDIVANILSDGTSIDVQSCQRKCMTHKEECAFVIFGGDQIANQKDCIVLGRSATCRRLRLNDAWSKSVSSYEFLPGLEFYVNRNVKNYIFTLKNQIFSRLSNISICM